MKAEIKDQIRKLAEEEEQYFQDEFEQAKKRGGLEYAASYYEGIKDGYIQGATAVMERLDIDFDKATDIIAKWQMLEISSEQAKAAILDAITLKDC